MDVRIKTRRLVLRPVRLADRDTIFGAFTPEVVRYMEPAPPEGPEDTERFLRETLERMERGEELVCAITEGGELIGCAGVHHLDTEIPELGVWIKTSRHGAGRGSEAVGALHAWASANTAAEVFRYPVDKENIASRRIAEKLGGTIAAERERTTADGRALHLLEYHIPPLVP